MIKRLTALLLALAAARLPAVMIDEIQVYTDDINAPGKSGDLTPNFRAAFGVSLGQRKDPDHERQKTYDGG